MLPEPFPDDQPDDPEPGASDPVGDNSGNDAPFAQNGRADTMAPGPLLATVLHAIVGGGGSELPGLSDDQLIGVLSGGRRREAYAAWVQLAAMRELARRRPAVEPGDSGRAGFSDFAADELMGEFRLSREAATGQIAYACHVAYRLPLTFAALEAGKIHPVTLKIIDEQTYFLSAENVAKADAALPELAPRRRAAASLVGIPRRTWPSS